MRSIYWFCELQLILVLLAIGSFVYGQDEYMTCSRPTKSSRSSKQLSLPCEGMEQGETWCNLPGTTYPWHAVRNFVFENQGLMRRMYGEVRQLSLLRMEFAGESNAIEEVSGRDFDDAFQPIIPSSLGPTPSTTSTLVSILSTVNQHENEGFASSMSASTTESSRLDDDDENNYSNERLTTVLVEEKDEGTTSHHVIDGFVDTVPTEEIPTTAATDVDSAAEALVIILQAPLPIPANNVTTTANDASANADVDENRDSSDADEKNRIEGHVLFQDYEKASSTPATTTTTTEEIESRVRSRVGVNACPVKEEVVAPYWANNTRGEILALLNLYPFEQYIHWEKCTNEHRQMYCRDGCRCEQQYRLHRLLAFDPSNECRGIFSDWFRFPSCCVCKCYFDEMPNNERVSFNRSPRIIDLAPQPPDDLDGPDVNGVDDSHFFYKYHHSFRHPRK